MPVRINRRYMQEFQCNIPNNCKWWPAIIRNNDALLYVRCPPLDGTGLSTKCVGRLVNQSVIISCRLKSSAAMTEEGRYKVPYFIRLQFLELALSFIKSYFLFTPQRITKVFILTAFYYWEGWVDRAITKAWSVPNLPFWFSKKTRRCLL